MKRGKSLLFVLVLGWVMTGCANPTPTLLNHTATPVTAALSPLPTPTVAIPPTMAPTATTEPTATLPPSPLETPMPFQRSTPGPTTTPFPGTPLDFETISQGDAGLSAPPEERWPFPPAFFVFASPVEWEDFVTTYRFHGSTDAASKVFRSISTDFDFDDNLLVLGLMHDDAICARTNHQVLSAWQDGDAVYIRVAWEDAWDVYLMSTGTMYVMASISRPEAKVGQELSFTLVSQWPPYYDGTIELVAIVTRSLP